MLSKVLAATRRFEVQLFWVAAILGTYLAVATLLRATRHPGSSWEPWHPLFVAMLVAAVFVPIYALLRSLDARDLRVDAAAAEVQATLELFCQRSVSAISDQCSGASVNDLSVQVWLCRDDGGFDRRAAFMLPEARPRSGIEWQRGKGIAGTAWARGKEVGADLDRLGSEVDRLGEKGFDRLPEEERYGMTASEVRKTANYLGVYAIPLFAIADPESTLGVFVIDYAGEGGFACVEACAQNRPVRVYAAACERILTEVQVKLRV